jgi:hypothetical protein
MIKSFETGTNPVRCAKFIVRKQYIVAGTDDMKLRVFNYNTMDKVRMQPTNIFRSGCLEYAWVVKTQKNGSIVSGHVYMAIDLPFLMAKARSEQPPLDTQISRHPDP